MGATAKQYPGTEEREDLIARAENAINGILEHNSGPDNGFLTCSSTTIKEPYKKSMWLQVDLKRRYFISEIELWLREGDIRRSWQRGLTVHVTNTPLGSSSGTSTLINPQNRCGQLYASYKDQSPKFPCYFPQSSQYVVLSLLWLSENSVLQVCEIQVFGELLVSERSCISINV